MTSPLEAGDPATQQTRGRVAVVPAYTLGHATVESARRSEDLG